MSKTTVSAAYVCGFIVLLLFNFNCKTQGSPHEKDPLLEESPFESISTFLMMGKPDKALEAYEKAFKENPEDLVMPGASLTKNAVKETKRFFKKRLGIKL